MRWWRIAFATESLGRPFVRLSTCPGFYAGLSQSSHKRGEKQVGERTICTSFHCIGLKSIYTTSHPFCATRAFYLSTVMASFSLAAAGRAAAAGSPAIARSASTAGAVVYPTRLVLSKLQRRHFTASSSSSANDGKAAPIPSEVKRRIRSIQNERENLRTASQQYSDQRRSITGTPSSKASVETTCVHLCSSLSLLGSAQLTRESFFSCTTISTPRFRPLLLT